jgi:hypothetical protein
MKGHKSRTNPKVWIAAIVATSIKTGQSAEIATALLLSPGTDGKLKTNYGIVQGLPTPGNQLTLQAAFNREN